MIGVLETACGRLWVCGDTTMVSEVSWEPIGGTVHGGELDWIMDGLDAYFRKRSRGIPGVLCFPQGIPTWSLHGTGAEPRTLFHQILSAISRIPYGETAAYSDIARALGNRHLARAVGQACKKNPLPVIVPCHRVVGSSSLGGYSSGIHRKEVLLKLEGVLAQE